MEEVSRPSRAPWDRGPQVLSGLERKDDVHYTVWDASDSGVRWISIFGIHNDMNEMQDGEGTWDSTDGI